MTVVKKLGLPALNRKRKKFLKEIESIEKSRKGSRNRLPIQSQVCLPLADDIQ